MLFVGVDKDGVTHMVMTDDWKVLEEFAGMVERYEFVAGGGVEMFELIGTGIGSFVLGWLGCEIWMEYKKRGRWK
ncbi:MAG: hypothetical protein PHG81_05775 [Aliarcobacter sp.]|nr:hypothetical protein [Aliarcobacter sp.]